MRYKKHMVEIARIKLVQTQSVLHYVVETTACFVGPEGTLTDMHVEDTGTVRAKPALS